MGADTEALQERGRRLGREAGEVLVVRRDFLSQGKPATTLAVLLAAAGTLHYREGSLWTNLGLSGPSTSVVGQAFKSALRVLHLENASRRTVRAADLVLIPCRTAILDLEAITDTVQFLATTGTPALVVLNAVSPHGHDADQASDALHTPTLDVCPVRVGHRVAFARALLTGQAAQEYDPGRVTCFAILLSVRDRSLCLRASEAEAQAAGHLNAADVNGNGAPI